TDNKSVEESFVHALANGDRRTMRRILQDELRGSQALAARRHDGADVAKEVAGDAFWSKAYKFTIERHPYEKAVSLAWFRAEADGNFAKALEEILEARQYRNFDLYSIDGKPAMDFIIRYEHLDEDVPKVEAAIGGLPILSRLPRANSHQRKDRSAAQDVL